MFDKSVMRHISWFERRVTRMVASAVLSLLSIYGFVAFVKGNRYVTDHSPYLVVGVVFVSWVLAGYIAFQKTYEIEAQVIGAVGIVLAANQFDALLALDVDPSLFVIGTLLPLIYVALTLIDTYRYVTGNLETQYKLLG